ncbi:hypothetical protein [Thermoactinomyces sp. DSM 45892]|uniref:hypothetical protein n=1 Tax=Thermoactinomyces sp. DSM 45892 TaxID=1882753 RepID=UPI0008990D76|nr:hypothetical protein [Thermoactinomyces sp. DSM 45892]SDZ27079.1 hypothetical protein SAMN05444416_11851 [Thermoactinomyces sp. DSM 45892]
MFSSDLGSSRAIWKGEKPVLNADYEVELEFLDTLWWGRDIVESVDNRYSISNNAHYVGVTGKLESVFEDGCVVIRLEDSIILLDTVGEPCSIGNFVRIQTKEIFLFDVAL